MTGKDIFECKTFGSNAGVKLVPAQHKDRPGVTGACLVLPLLCEDLYFKQYSDFWEFMGVCLRNYNTFLIEISEK